MLRTILIPFFSYFYLEISKFHSSFFLWIIVVVVERNRTMVTTVEKIRLSPRLLNSQIPIGGRIIRHNKKDANIIKWYSPILILNSISILILISISISIPRGKRIISTIQKTIDKIKNIFQENYDHHRSRGPLGNINHSILFILYIV